MSCKICGKETVGRCYICDDCKKIKQKESVKRYYSENKEKILQYHKEYYNKIKNSPEYEKIKERKRILQREYYKKNMFKKWSNKKDKLNSIINKISAVIKVKEEQKAKYMAILLKLENNNADTAENVSEDKQESI